MKNTTYMLSIVLSIVLFTACKSSKPKPNDYIGKEYKSLKEFEYFNDFEEKYGIALDIPNQKGYCLAMYQKESFIIIALEKTVKHVNGAPVFQLLNILEIDSIKKNQTFNFGSCRVNGEIDPTVIAIYNIIDPNVYIFTNISRAWRININSKQFEQIDIQGIDCINEDYGIGVN